MFDLSKNVILEKKWQTRYLILRAILYFVFILGGLYVAYMLFFPPKEFFIDLMNPNSKNNSLSYTPSAQNENIFSAYSREIFSKATITFTSANADLSGKNIEIRNTYSALTSPLSEKPAPFPDGSLVKNDAKYYLVSDGKLRKFATLSVAENMGYFTDSFLEASPYELSLNELGEEITDVKNYPDDMLFLVEGNYYKLQNKILFSFASENAFLSFYDKKQAVAKDNSLIVDILVSEDVIGFANGTLLSFDNAVFIVVDGKVMPFNNPLTFLAFGYQWKDVVPANEAETGLYERDKLFTVDRPHPDGTIFYTTDSKKYFIIANGQKQEIKGTAILKSLLGSRDPISALEKSLDFTSACILEKKLFSSDKYTCSLLVSELAKAPGKEYQFRISPAVPIQTAAITFYRDINLFNLKNSLSEIKVKTMLNYGIVQPE